MNAEGRGTPPDLSADAQALLSAISERTSIGNGRLRTTTGLDEDAYKAAVAELVAAGLVRRGRGRGGSVALVGDSVADAATNGTSTRRSPEGPRPAAREIGEDEEATVDPAPLAGPGGLFAKIRAHVDTDVGRGLVFQRLMKAFLIEDPFFKERFSKVWQWGEWPGRKGEPDTGIDLVAEERTGGVCAIQCKFYAERTTISREDIDRFLVSSGRRPFTARLFISTTERWGKNAEKAIADQQVPVQRIGVAELENSPFDWSRYDPEHPAQLFRRAHKQLRSSQRHAINDVKKGFETRDRGKLIMACGTGKTLTSLRLAEETVPAGGTVLFCVPSISLLSQTLRAWMADSERPLHAVAVCSDSQVTKGDEDIHVYDLALPATTRPAEIAERIGLAHEKGKGEEAPLVVVFSTYQSLDRVAEAQKRGAPVFDLIICDEAHRTTGALAKEEEFTGFTLVHDDQKLKGARRVYMTATPRLYSDSAKERAADRSVVLCSMDNEALYGPEFHRLSFGKAVEEGLLSDYRVVVLMVDEGYANEVAHSSIADDDLELVLQDAARLIGCWRGLSKQGLAKNEFGYDPEPMRRVVAFSTTIKYSKRVTSALPPLVETARAKELDGIDVETRHVDGTMGSLERDQALAWLREDPPEGSCRVLSNAKCLSEGVDVPALDAVIFTNPRKSQVDVVQAVGRVMRRSPDKRYGYVIIPVPVPAGEDPERVLDDNDRYRVVWQVLQALRAHDDRFDAVINKLDLNKTHSNVPLQVVGIGGAGEREADRFDTGHLALQWQGLEDKVYARVVKHVGRTDYLEDWAEDVARIAQSHITRIKTAVGVTPDVKEAFGRFVDSLRRTLNPSVSDAEAIEMLAQHLITAPIFDALFGNSDFTRKNPVAEAMGDVLVALHEQEAIEAEREELGDFYRSVRRRIEGIDNLEGRQRVIKGLYEVFFKRAFPFVADRLGIVYTPVEIVDFMLKSVDHVLREQFGSKLGAKDVHVLDPFTGTGTFIARALALMERKDLERAYGEFLHANETVLLAYYVAAANIEEVYHSLRGEGDYEPFPGIVLADTFQMGEGDDELLPEYLRPNSERAKRQKKLPITVVVSNPPYSVGQGSQNDNNKNPVYPYLDGRIEATYAARSSAGLKRNLYDSYIRAFRWASDRIGERGIVCFVSNGAFIDSGSADGFRKALAEEFSAVYCFDLRGSIRGRSGDRAKREGGNPFNIMTGVAITVLVKDPGHFGLAEIHYYDIGDYLSREEKLAKVVGFGDLAGVPWGQVTPNAAGDWINQRSEVFETLQPLGDKDPGGADAVFSTYSLGVVTNRDAWAYNFSRRELLANMAKTIDAYNVERERFHAQVRTGGIQATDETANAFVDPDPAKVSWTVNLKSDLRKDKSSRLVPERAVPSMYRPFCKQRLYFDRQWNERVLLMPSLFPTPVHENRVIAVSGIGDRNGFAALVCNTLPNLNIFDKSQCFPRYRYTKAEDDGTNVAWIGASSGYERHDAITPRTLDRYRERYGDKVTADDVFHYIYGLLHSPEYTSRFAADLGKMIPRIPMVEDFWAFASAGAALADWHLGYETVAPWPLDGLPDDSADPKALRVEKMSFAKKGDRASIVVNSHVTLSGIPDDAYRYQVNGRSAVEWILDRYQVKTDPASGIVNDPNTWSDDPHYIVDLLARIVTVSLESVQIIDSLPPLGI